MKLKQPEAWDKEGNAPGMSPKSFPIEKYFAAANTPEVGSGTRQVIELPVSTVLISTKAVMRPNPDTQFDRFLPTAAGLLGVACGLVYWQLYGSKPVAQVIAQGFPDSVVAASLALGGVFGLIMAAWKTATLGWKLLDSFHPPR